MENYRIIKQSLYYIALGGMLLALPLFVFGYDDHTTHPALTQEMVKFYNQSFPKNKLNYEEKNLVIQGSIDEDLGIRWLQHFYDPVYNRGLMLENDAFPKNPNLALVASGARLPRLSSKTWALSSASQKNIFSGFMAGIFKDYFSDDNDYSWERAVYEYAWDDKKRGLESLGHVLHLLEDATVPDHTRNDPHPPVLDMGSPYEAWTKKFDLQNIDIADKLKDDKPTLLLDLATYFDKIASYSNNNFFSKDTIFSPKYKKPNITIRNNFGYVTDEFGNKFKIIKIVRSLGNKELTYSLEDEERSILSDYWSLLSKQAVLNGAGVIKLFFDEVEKEKQTKILYNKNRSWLAREIDKFKRGTFNIASVLYGITASRQDLEESSPENFNQEPDPKPIENLPEKTQSLIAAVSESVSPPASKSSAPKPSVKPSATQTIKNSTPSALKPELPPAPTPKKSAPPSNISPSVPIAGGGAASASPESSSATPSDTTPPSPPAIQTPTPNQTITSASVSFSGTAEVGAIISQDFSNTTTTVNPAGNWSLTLSSLPQGTSTVQFFAADSSGNRSSAATRIIFIDSVTPDFSFSVNECGQSISPESCLVATTTINLSWGSTASDIDHYEITCALNGSLCSEFSFSPTSATSATYSVPVDSSSYTFTAKAVDVSGNQSPTITQTMEIFSRPLIINEIGWTGTSATRAQDEWIEIKNITSRILNLSGVTLKSLTDNKPNIALSGTLAPQAFYLIERTDDTTISDITASTTASFGSGSGAGLSNSGEILALEYNGATLDRTPEVSACTGWCGGVSGQYYSMERYDPYASGENSSNWGTWNGLLPNGVNADGVVVNGTPGKRNNLSYLISKDGGALSQNKTLAIAYNPYIVTGNYTIQNGVTLTIGPGVILKFYVGSGLQVEGILRAEGTATSPVVFTSMDDDPYGGDTNQNGSSTSPTAGSWTSIKILGSGSMFDHTIIRYGGAKDLPSANYWANIRAQNVALDIKNSIIEYSGAYGVWLKNVTGLIQGNTFRYNNATANTQSTGLNVEDGSLTIQNNIFNQNSVGLFMSSAGSSHTLNVSDNTFTANSGEAIFANGVYPLFSGNIATNNGTNGITFQGTINQDYTLARDLPYILTNTLTVAANKVLTILEGVIVKLSGSGAISVLGKLMAQGTAANHIVFTSINDDNFGGDTASNGSSTPALAGDWLNIYFGSSSGSSTLQYTRIRYGGTRNNLDPNQGAVRIENSSIDILNSFIERNYSIGAWLKNSTSTSLIDSTVQDHQEPSSSYGMFLDNSSPFIKDSIFRNNKTGIRAANSSVQNGGGNVFENNTTDTDPVGLIP